MKSYTYNVKYFLVLVVLFTLSISCKKYLEARQDKTLIVPTSVKELQGLLDIEILCGSFPNGGNIADDNAYISFEDWQFLPVQSRDNYIWKMDVELSEDWRAAYNRILYSNVVLNTINDLSDPQSTLTQRNMVKGTALFYRAINFYELAQLFSPQYSSASAETSYGIPLKISADVEDITKRSTVGQTYNKIIEDLKTSIDLLPTVGIPKTRPGKTASWGLLARTFLVMHQYDSAAKYANLSLQAYDYLLDYNLIPYNEDLPFSAFHEEVIFHANTRSDNSFSVQKIDTVLYNSYDINDLRKVAFFRTNADGTFSPKGNYSGLESYSPFAGIGTDEVLLIRAECSARKGFVQDAMDDLNTLLVKRWLSGNFTPYSALNAADALNKILSERRKELVFRSSLRWSDLRRLNLENSQKTIITRVLNGQIYQLTPDDKRYTFLIPQSVVNISKILQNQR